MEFFFSYLPSMHIQNSCLSLSGLPSLPNILDQFEKNISYNFFIDIHYRVTLTEINLIFHSRKDDEWKQRDSKFSLSFVEKFFIPIGHRLQDVKFVVTWAWLSHSIRVQKIKINFHQRSNGVSKSIILILIKAWDLRRRQNEVVYKTGQDGDKVVQISRIHSMSMFMLTTLKPQRMIKV